MICDDLDGWDEGAGRLKREGVHVYIELIHSVVQRKHNIAKQLYAS